MPRPDKSRSAGFGNGATARLRADIDRGRTGDKVDFPDLATAPLGTDEEAAGTQLPTEAVEETRAIETAREAAEPRQRGLGATWILIAFIGLFAVGIVAYMYGLSARS